ncbi:MAG: NAD-dependent epimerase/dehydratase family protein [Bacteroidota bacterium]
MKKALVTGGCGFVGRHLVRRLVNMDYHVTIVDNFFPGSGFISLEKWPEIVNIASQRDRIKFYEADCRDFFKEDLSYYDDVYHLAAVVGGRMVIERDPLAVGTDLSIDADFFYWLSRLQKKPGKVHYFSSSAAYPIKFQGVTNHRILNENDIDFSLGNIGVPDLTYGWSKLTGEFLAKTYYNVYNAPIVCYRPFSGYGEDQDLTYPFPSIVKRCMETPEEIPVTVWGSGKQSRDFVYIEDCIDLICDYTHSINDASAINISTAISTDFNTLAHLVLKLLNKKNVIINSSDKPEGVYYRVGDTSLQHSIGFTDRTLLHEGIQRTINFFEK